MLTDPSFTGFGISTINIQHKILIFDETSVEVGEGSFAEITAAAVQMEEKVNKTNYFDNAIVGMEIPPVSGFYAVKLWALDSRIYNNIKAKANQVWLFNVPYLKFINGKKNSKKDTMKMIDDIVKVFKENEFKIIQTLKDKRGKDRKLTSNQCDSFLYCLRVFTKHCIENGIEGELVQDILNVNDKFLIEKETLTGKHSKI